MNKIQKYENEQSIKTLDELIEFLNNNNTRVELVETTPIGKKYIAMYGYDKKEVYITADNTVITEFHKNQYVSREVVFHNGQSIKSKIHMITTRLEKSASNNNLKSKAQYCWKRFKEIAKENFRIQH